MKIVAFDLGSNLAYATNCSGSWVGAHGCLGDRRERAWAAMKWFEDVIEHLKGGGLECVIYECPFARSLATTRSLWGLAGILEAVARKYEFEALDIQPTKLKAWATGSGRASKADMIAAAQQMGYTGANEHEADAFCLLKWAEANLKEIPHG